jgi:hypothetical protein
MTTYKPGSFMRITSTFRDHTARGDGQRAIDAQSRVWWRYNECKKTGTGNCRIAIHLFAFRRLPLGARKRTYSPSRCTSAKCQ